MLLLGRNEKVNNMIKAERSYVPTYNWQYKVVLLKTLVFCFVLLCIYRRPVSNFVTVYSMCSLLGHLYFRFRMADNWLAMKGDSANPCGILKKLQEENLSVEKLKSLLPSGESRMLEQKSLKSHELKTDPVQYCMAIDVADVKHKPPGSRLQIICIAMPMYWLIAL